jgi:hypothetical protein
MDNFLRSLFGSKKSPSKIKPRMQSRRLELIGLEERITPAVTASGASGILALTTSLGEDLTSVVVNADGTLTVSATTAAGAPIAVTAGSGASSLQVGTSNAYTIAYTNGGGTADVTSISLVGDTVGNQDFTIAGMSIAGFAQANVGLTVNMGADATGIDTLNFTTATVTLKGSGALATSNIDAINIAAAADITTGTGAVGISATTISTAGDVNTTTATGDVTYTGAVTLTGNVVLTTTGGDTTITGAVVGGTSNLTTSSGAGNFSITGAVVAGAISVTSTGTIGFGAAVTAASVATVSSSGGAVTLGGTVTTTGLVNFAGAVTGTTSVNVVAGTTATFGSTVNTPGAISVLGLGDLTFTGSVGNTSATSVTAKSLTGDVIFGDTVTSSNLGGFISEATSVTKATKIANLVTLAANANAVVTGNLISNNATLAAITTSGVGNITITGNVDASVANNALTLTAGSAVSIGGNVGSGAIAFGTLTASGTGTFLAAGTVTAGSIKLDQSNKFATSITFAKAVTVSDSPGGIEVNASGSGTVTFSDTITALGAAGNNTDIEITSVNGVINVGGAITGLDKVAIISSGSGSITLIGNVTTSGNSTTQDNGLVLVQSTTGNITTVGVISTSGSLADIEIDTATSGNITIGGNVSTSGGGDILLGADFGGVATGAGNVTINGTVTTTGAGAGDILIGISGGTATVNQALTAGPTGDVVFLTNLATDAITVVSGATITAGDSVGDFGSGILNLGANITSGTTGVAATLGIFINDVSVNLTGDVSLKSIGTGGGAGIFLGKVNGAQNLTLESTDQILLGSVGQAIALNTVTVTNSGGVTAGAFTAANVVLTDTTGTIAFGGTTVITNSLTTAAKAYDVTFAGTSVLSGAPVFLNTGNVTFGSVASDITSLTTGATITGSATSTVDLGGTIVSGGAFNIGALPATTTVANATQLILNSTTAASNFAGKVVSAGTGANALSLLGVGTLTLSGDSSTSLLGGIDVINGTLNVTGKLGATSVSTATSGTISGAGGTIGALTVNTGTVAPGGTLNTGAVTLNAATNYSAAVLTTTTAANLKTASAINLGGATLSLSSVAAGLAVNNTFTIIDNTAVSGLVTGTFANQPEGSSISAKDTAGNTVTFIVSYIGGTNANDVTLKVSSITSATPTPTAPAQPMVAGQPALNKFTAVGADAGGGPLVTITFQNGTFVSFFAYASTFTGGVRVALGDVNGDGSTDVITGAGPGGGPQVNVYNVNNATGVVSLQKSFFAFSAPSFTGGVYVAAGNTNGDAFADVIVGAGATGGSRVQVYAGSATGVVTTSTLNDFFAYSPAFTGGVVVAAGQRDAVAGDEIITAPASGGGYNIKSFNANGTGNNPTVVDNFFAFNNTTSVGGLSLAVGLLNSGSIADLIVGTTNGGYGVIVDSATAGIAGVPFAGFTGAIRAGVAEDANGQDFAVALAGPTGAPRISVFSVGATALTQTDSLFVMNTGFTGGLFGTPTLPATIVVA